MLSVLPAGNLRVEIRPTVSFIFGPSRFWGRSWEDAVRHSVASHGRIDSWSTRDLKRLQALRQPVATSGSICSGFVNRWSGVQISHPAPTNQRVTVVSATDLFRRTAARPGARALIPVIR